MVKAGCPLLHAVVNLLSILACTSCKAKWI